VFLPTWPIDRVRRRRLAEERRSEDRRRSRDGERAVRRAVILLVRRDHGRQLIAGCCPRASTAGVSIGMTLAQARALVGSDRAAPDRIEADHEPERDAAALHRLAAWAIRFSPVVAPDVLRHDGLLLDVTGCEPLYGGEARLLRIIRAGFDRLGIANRACVAGTIGGAWAVARFGSETPTIVAPGGERAAISPCSIAALRVDASTIDALHEVNVHRVGELLAIPRAELAARFDPALLRRVDQALGGVDEVIDPIRPPEAISAERDFDGAVTRLDALLLTGRELVERLGRALERAGAGALRLDLTAQRLDATPIRDSLRLSHPSRDVRHLWSLLRPRIESIHMGFGIERISLAAPIVRRTPHRMPTRWFDGEAPPPQNIDRAAGELIDTLSHRLGAERALRVDVIDAHLPERVVVMAPALTSGSAWLRAARTSVARTSGPPRVGASAFELHDDAEHPSMLLDAPEPIDVTVAAPDGPPQRLRWRGVEHHLTAALGPRRLSPEWWRRPHSASVAGERDYFRVQDSEGRWLWVYRLVGDERWFVHGQWT